MAAQESALAPVPLDDPSLYLNRELSLLAFQRRVLEEAADPRHPLLERAKFLSILFSNVDEFFMVRVAGLMQKLESGKPELSVDGKPVSAQLEAIRAEVTRLVDDAYEFFQARLMPELNQNHIHIVDYATLNEEQRAQMETYFEKTVFPALTPLAFDPGRPFPHISNLSLNIAVVVKQSAGENFARVKVPDILPQLIRVPLQVHAPGDGSPQDVAYLWLDQLIIANVQLLFPGIEIVDAHPFHVTRDAEVAIKEVESDDLLETIEDAVWERRFRDVVRLQVHATMPERILNILMSNLEVDASDVYQVPGPIDLGRLKSILGVDRPDLKDKPFTPIVPPSLVTKEEDDIFARIRQRDVLVHYPFESFQPLVELLRKAARDPDVLAIKMTLYRTGRNSPVVEALVDAIENGKQVAVLVELKARFDEESNIEWARKLDDAGVHVVYGLVGLKVHAKLTMVVRREGDTIRRYINLSTGNYNASTARVYTDLSLFTTNEEIASDVTDLFNYLTGYSAKKHYRKLLVAPVNMRQQLIDLIQREIEHQGSGAGGYMILKMNALEDPEIIKELYRASQAGVKIDLLVRGICCLRPGLPGISETIRVTSILGRFLEHSRIYYFQNGGKDRVFLGSADLMPRNLSRRVEILFPVEDPRLKKRLREEILQAYLNDHERARVMRSDGTYFRDEARDGSLDSQAYLLNAAARL